MNHIMLNMNPKIIRYAVEFIVKLVYNYISMKKGGKYAKHKTGI
jgi:hypothetical protein